ncbi:unnamed protein product [Macrosiphum euphorbiae]|uniref:Uncharacterized protein n=1 Tax=Macrosiphum euphorbiae TaxID=13131 RepID=A0AAV0WYY3_9HEMI|nr:unnamed protein product [Macrosiphum euphorbiae]
MRATPNEIDDVIKRARCDVWTSETISQCITTIHRKGCGEALRLCAVSIQVFAHVLPRRAILTLDAATPICTPSAVRHSRCCIRIASHHNFSATAGCPQALCSIIVVTGGPWFK